MKIYILAKIIIEGYYNRYYTPMIDAGAEANIYKYNCLPEDKWEKLKTPIVVTGFNKIFKISYSPTTLPPTTLILL